MKTKSIKSINKYKSLLKLYLINETLSNPYKTFINLFDKQTQKHMPLSKETIRSCISAIIWFIEDRKPKNAKKLLNIYRLIMTHLRKSCLYDTRTNFLYKQKQIPWENILEIRNDYKNKVLAMKKKHPQIIIEGTNNKDKLNLQEKSLFKKYLISCIYTYNPPRRLLDYACMNIINNITDFNKLKKNKPEEVKKHNYYVIDNKLFIFCYYKTVKIYNEQFINVNDELDKIIKDYINSLQLSPGKLLFGNKDFEQLVRNTFNAGINTIRHSYITYVYNRGNLNANLIDKISKQMAHSVKTNIGYYKSLEDTETLTFTFTKEEFQKQNESKNIFDDKNNVRFRLKNAILMLIVCIVVQLCIFRYKKYSNGKKNIKYIEETPINSEIDMFLKK